MSASPLHKPGGGGPGRGRNTRGREEAGRPGGDRRIGQKTLGERVKDRQGKKGVGEDSGLRGRVKGWQGEVRVRRRSCERH